MVVSKCTKANAQIYAFCAGLKRWVREASILHFKDNVLNYSRVVLATLPEEKTAEVDFPASAVFITISAVRGGETVEDDKGDIAVDLFRITEGACGKCTAVI